MTKVLNQQLISAVIYGGQASGSTLSLYATSGLMQGAVRVTASSLDLIIGGVAGTLIHGNTSARTYTLPDYSGLVLTSGIFTAAGQLVYGTGAGTAAALAPVASSALVTDPTGTGLQWTTGTTGQVLTFGAGGVVQFSDIPDKGTVGTNLGATPAVPYYAGAGNVLTPLTSVAGRTLLTDPLSGLPLFGLISAGYLAGPAAGPLSNGSATNVLTSAGDGTFAWVPANPAVINADTQFKLPYYSAAGTGTTLSGSSFLTVNETLRALQLTNLGRLRLYQAATNGTSYLEFRAPAVLGPSVSWVLPGTDGAAGAFLTTDGAGNLSFVYVDNGKVLAGAQNQLAYYAGAGNTVQGLSTTASRALLSTGAGALAWNLITAGYLSSSALGTALGNGTLNQVLVSAANGGFAWANAADLLGEIQTGQANYLAYYPAAGKSIKSSGFLSIDDTLRILSLEQRGTLRLYDSSNTRYLSLKAPVTLSGSLDFVLPTNDGSANYALVTDGSQSLSFIEVGFGQVQPLAAPTAPATLAYYDGTTTGAGYGVVKPFPLNINPRVLVNPGSSQPLSWLLLTATYLSGPGGVSELSNGIPGQVLTPDGAGNFQWDDPVNLVGKINSGVGQALTYYPATAAEVSGSSWLANDEGAKALKLKSQGQLHFNDLANDFYLSFQAPAVLAASTTWTLPFTDATLSGQVLQSDGSGSLSFIDQVDPGVSSAVATYQNGTDRRVSPSSNLLNSALGLELLGTTFSITGAADLVSPTDVILAAGDDTGGGSGGDLSLYAGASAGGQPGTFSAGYAGTSYLTIEELSAVPSVSLRPQTQLLFWDGMDSNYVGFKGPASALYSVAWTLPSADGLLNQVLTTDGSGTLSWQDPVGGGGGVNPGTTGALSYYTGAASVSSSVLLNPTSSLPLDNGYALTVDTGGQLDYALLVETGGVAGTLSIYTADQTVGGASLLSYDGMAGTLSLKDQLSLLFFDTLTSRVALGAPSALGISYDLTLPVDPPANAGQVLIADTQAGQLKFVNPSADTRYEKRGAVQVSQGASEVTVIYDSPFLVNSAAQVVNAQWMISGATPPEILPTIGIGQNTLEGFVIRLSSPAPGPGYSLSWLAYQDSINTDYLFYAFLAGGYDGANFYGDVEVFQLDLDSSAGVIPSLLSSPRGYCASSSDASAGRIIGGADGVTSSITTVTSYLYASLFANDLPGSLPAPRSDAASTGNKTKGFALGGQDRATASTYLSVVRLFHSTDTVALTSSSLAQPSVNGGSATSYTAGYAVDNTGSVERISYASEVVSVTASSFPAGTVSVGCNHTEGGMAYFGDNTGTVSTYDTNTDTITALGGLLSSVTGLSSAFNSLRKGYFSGSTNIDSVEFATGTFTQVNTLVNSGKLSASVTAFQTKGTL